MAHQEVNLTDIYVNRVLLLVHTLERAELPAFTSSSSKYGFSGLKGIHAIKVPGEPLSPAYLKLFSVCTNRSSLGLSSSSGGSAA